MHYSKKKPTHFIKEWDGNSTQLIPFLIPALIFQYLPVFEDLLSIIWQKILSPIDKDNLVTVPQISENTLESASQQAQLFETLFPDTAKKFKEECLNNNV